MDNQKTVQEILKAHYVESAFFTHISMLQPKGKFQFNRQELEEFWVSYCNLIKNNKNAIVGVAEKPQYYLPVLCDLDIKVKENELEGLGLTIDNNHLYTDSQLSQVVQIYQSVLRNIVDECRDENLLCVVLEKPMYTVMKGDIKYFKSGFHLHWPNIFLSKVDQEVHLIPRVQENLRELDLFANLGFEDSGNLIDKSCCTVSWLLYGSRKSEDMEPYRVTKVINSDFQEVTLEDAFKRYRIYDIREQLINIKGRVCEYLPRILSIIPYGRTTHELKHGLISPLKEKLMVKKQVQKVNKVSVSEALEISGKLLPMLALFRSEDRNEWMTIGWILYNIGDGSSEALDQWLDFSARCEESYDESRCIYEWERMVKKDLTLGTLRYFASIDSPDKYREFIKEKAQHYINEAVQGSHNDIAKLLYQEYSTEFVCASIASPIWYQFINHKWEEVDNGITLREKISSEVLDKYVKMSKSCVSSAAETADRTEELVHNTRLKQVQKLSSNLKCAPYKNNVMVECEEVFYDRRFRQKLDTNPYLIAFKNGVYDLKLNIFRNGRPEDFLSKAMPIEYVEYSEDDEEVLFVHNYLEQVFPDKSLRQYFMDMASDVFVGGNHQKVVLFWTGEGDNGKSVTQSLFEKMLGDLAIKFSTTLITGKKTQTGGANPELARAGSGVRWAVLEEPDGDEQINIGTMKSLSGNDSYWARDLFEKGKATREIQPLFKLIFITNKLPKLKYSDKATWNRVRVIPFESTFVRPGEPCPETYEEQILQKRFPMDKEFTKKIPGMLQPFAWILLQHRQKITVRIEPEKVRQATAIYRKQNDIYRQFIEECIIEENEVSLTMIELYAQFKEWFKESFPHHSIPIKNEVKEYFERLWGDCDRGCKWKGYRIRTLQDNIDSGDAVVLEEEDLVDYENNGKKLPPL
uniref:SF3 helicase domain-containing protein n=1 Tax=viral metagenome TaxID=1070528 RepID=A0A6C0D0F3_9ZZZZ